MDVPNPEQYAVCRSHVQLQVRNGEHELVSLILASFTVSLTKPISELLENLKVVSMIATAYVGRLAKCGKGVFVGFCGPLGFLENSP